MPKSVHTPTPRQWDTKAGFIRRRFVAWALMPVFSSSHSAFICIFLSPNALCLM